MTDRPLRIVGAEWAQRYPTRYPDRRPRASGGGAACPVCGNPTGDCAPHLEETDMPGKTRRTPPTPAARDASTGVPTRKTAATSTPATPAGDATPTPAPAATPARPAPQEAAQPSGAVTSALDEVELRDRAFIEGTNGMLTSVKRVVVEFTPHGTVRPSRTQMFGIGQSYSRAQIAHKLSMYSDRDQAHLIYRDT